ncbi:DUF4058 family protein [Prosthecobacter sp.]|uniref:DUF4058 family protein n=1 Tax=Prosthecobacter sp. TaxID=1965333 RepID=UPI00378394CC
MPPDAPYPFPGLNPYFEEQWFQVHPTMIASSLSRLQRQMPADLKVSIEQGMKISTRFDDDKGFRPDVSVWKVREDTLLASAPPNFSPPIVRDVTAPKPRHLTIRELGGDLVTVIELLSPTNKHGAGALAYLQKRLGLMESCVNLVEIDLIRKGGLALLRFEDDGMAEAIRMDSGRLPPHAVTVFRAEQPQQRELYRVTYQESLPAIRVPLRPDDQDVWLNLQELAGQCHTDCGFDKSTHYSRDPEPPLMPEDAAWLHTHLQSTHRR